MLVLKNFKTFGDIYRYIEPQVSQGAAWLKKELKVKNAAEEAHFSSKDLIVMFV